MQSMPSAFGALLALASATALSTACGAARGTATSEVLGGAKADLPTSQISCPKDFWFDASSRLCTDQKEAQGPFPTAMIQRCRDGGGGAACSKDRWAFNFAKNIRGNNWCALGTEWDGEVGACIEGEYAFGPFAVALVEECRTHQSDFNCDTIRWPKEWVRPIRSSPLHDTLARFTLTAPSNAQQIKSLWLWATYYLLPVVPSVEDGFPLRDMNGDPLGPRLAHRDWCDAAMEGSVYVLDGSEPGGTTYNYAGSVRTHRVDCSNYFRIEVGHSKFRLANGRYGDGVDQYILNPFRTIAVDSSVIPYGTVLYIPAAKGNQITLPTGESVTHDGYFYAADKGGAIRDTHIDVYIGPTTVSPFPWIGSSPNRRFKAYVVSNPDINWALSESHLIHPSHAQPIPTPESTQSQLMVSEPDLQ